MRLGAGLVALVLACAVGCSSGSGDSQKAPKPLSLVVIGDSIPYNSPDDCPGCVGFVDQYAKWLASKTGRKVDTQNLSQHVGLDLPGLMDELSTFKEALSGADAIIVGIAHNTIPLNADKPCGSTFDEATSTLTDWSRVNRDCARRGTSTYRPMYDRLYSTIAGWRNGRPTLLLTINKYSDWLGWPAAHLTPDQEERTVLQHDTWNQMLCDSAEHNGFTCVDIYHAFNGADGTSPAGELLGADYTHPSQRGNDLIASKLIAKGFAPLD
jgi:lysophospholipase L1-like esterase